MHGDAREHDSVTGSTGGWKDGDDDGVPRLLRQGSPGADFSAQEENWEQEER